MNTIDSSKLLNEMYRLAQKADGVESNNKVGFEIEGKGSDFGQLFTQALGTVNELQMQAGALEDKVIKGDPSVTLAESVIAGQKASVAFEATLQVKNRLVQAYQDIMNMPL